MTMLGCYTLFTDQGAQPGRCMIFRNQGNISLPALHGVFSEYSRRQMRKSF